MKLYDVNNVIADERCMECHAIFDNTAVGIAVVRGNIVQRCNARLGEIYGADANALIGKHTDLLAIASEADLHRLTGPAGVDSSSSVFTSEAQARRTDGTPFWIRATAHVLATFGPDTKAVWIIEDVTERKQAQIALQQAEKDLELRVEQRTRELERNNARLRREVAERTLAERRSWHAAHHDALTGLANRVMLHERLNHAIQLARRHHGSMAVMYLDIDHFKSINDRLGHHVGDRFLCSIASRLQCSVRATDLVARIGGDEFVVLLEELHHADDAVLVAHKALETLAAELQLDSHSLTATASIGISRFPEHGGDGETLLRHADVAMYHAKACGRNAIRVYDESMVKGATRAFKA